MRAHHKLVWYTANYFRCKIQCKSRVNQAFDIKLYENGNSCHSQTFSELPGLPMGGYDVAVFHIYPLTLSPTPSESLPQDYLQPPHSHFIPATPLLQIIIFADPQGFDRSEMHEITLTSAIMLNLFNKRNIHIASMCTPNGLKFKSIHIFWTVCLFHKKQTS